MARISKNLMKGTVGAVNFREQNGKQIVSSKVAKGKIKHTPNTKRASNTFGRASILGGAIRTSFNTWIGGVSDISMVNRMNGKLIQAFIDARNPESDKYFFSNLSFQTLIGFDFNLKSPFRKNFKEEPVFQWVDGNLNFQCGIAGTPLNLKFPKDSSRCEITVSVALIRLDAGKRLFSPLKQSILIDKSKPVMDGLEMTFKVPPGCLFVAGVFLKFFTVANTHVILLNTKAFNPAAICSAGIIPGKFVKTNGAQWSTMAGLKLDLTKSKG